MNWLMRLLGQSETQKTAASLQKGIVKSLIAANVTAYTKTDVNSDTYELSVEFRAKRWNYIIRCDPNKVERSRTHIEVPEHFRHIFSDLSFDDAVKLAEVLKKARTAPEIPEFIKPDSNHTSLGRGSPPRVS